MNFENVKLTILYGSQTGNAQEVAERIWRQSQRFYFKSLIKSLDEYNVLELVNENCAVFVCSTTGQGEEPDNMKAFWKFLLKKNLPADSLSHLRFAVFGLGDSSYVKFNFVAKRLHKRLLQLGGQSINQLGLGDDQHDLGYDAAADPWIENLWDNLLNVYPLPSGIKPLSKNLRVLPRWNVTSILLGSSHSVNFQQSIYYSTRKSDDFTATVLENRQLTHQDHFQDVRLLKLQTNGQKYLPGDLVVLRPKNLQQQIDEFIEVLVSNKVDIPDDTVFKISENTPGSPIPDCLKIEVTFRQLCEEYFDLFSIPRRHVFQILSQLTDSELEREKCLEFTTAEGQQELYGYVNRPRRNIVEVLRDFPHATKNLTKEMLFEILPAIKPREFSIASSFKAHSNEVHVLLAVVKYKTKLLKERIGLCSNFLANLHPGDEITAWLKKGSFRFPEDNNNLPIVMVGPGTGVAPFRSYIFEKCTENSTGNDNLILFYGCRYKDKDFLCKSEFETLSAKNGIKVICAFSRDQEQKIYVQDKIKENKELVWKALERNAYIFIAGNARNMPQSVRQALVDVCKECGKMSEEQAEKFIQKAEKSGRYQTECWS